jgi:hypothetical protein
MRIYMGRRSLIVMACALAAPAANAADDAPGITQRADTEFFETHVRPLLAEKCYRCHGPEKQENELRLDSRAGILAGGLTGPAVVPGKPEESLIVEAIRYEEAVKMPPKAKLEPGQIEAIVRWVESGAHWPGNDPGRSAAPAATAGTEEIIRGRAGHWSFQPIRRVTPPEVRDTAWPSNAIDRFLLAKHEEHGLRPASQADRRTLIRRLSFDLLGLPPAPAEVEAFVADAAPDAYERLVDRLLASPRHGERWGRHWLDLVRYAETSGHEFDYDIPHAYRYRDYVVRAINDDLPYDQFITEHLAGDLLASPRRDLQTGLNESIVATGFFLLGEGTHSPVDVREEQLRRIDNQIDVLGKAFLGLTIACARCHDHKFDPIRARDYYALAGYMKSARHQQAFLDETEEARKLARELRETVRAIAALLEPPPTIDPPAKPSPDPDLFEDFEKSDHAGWFPSGLAFGDAPSQAGDGRLLPDGRLSLVPPGVAHSGLASDKLQGVLRSRTFTIDRQLIHVLAAGRHGRVQVVIDGFEKIRDPIYGGLIARVETEDAFTWHTLNLSQWIGQRAYIELADGGVADFTGSVTAMAPSEGFIAVDEIRLGDGPAPDRAGLKATLVDPRDGLSDPSTRPVLEDLLTRMRTLSEGIHAPVFAPSLADGTGEDERVLLRGNHKTPSERAPRGFLEVFSGDASSETVGDAGSRLDLARMLLDPSDPLPARVIVNRLWLHHFGRGLVPTPDDFGHMGQAPAHRELLDWLARELVESGWSLKHIHRLILTSRAFRMVSTPDPASHERDPENRWLHHATIRRLEAEPLRDAMLAAADSLDQRLYGPSVPPHLTEFMQGRGRPAASGPLDGDNCRSLYLGIRRNFVPPFFLAFDFPPPATTMGRRNVSNVPAQALTLLNDPFVIEMSRRWAANVCGRTEESRERRIVRMFETALGRPPAGDELASALRFVESPHVDGDLQAWADLAQVLFNHKEFLFIP